MSQEWLVVAGLIAVGWLWWDGLQKRELALVAARRTCERAGVQLLDETVTVKRFRLRRDEDQRMRLYREYGFEYSDNGDNRLPGRVFLLGARILEVNLIITRAT
ncbi:MAG: DUF3301 domain-containing protein [Thiobacillaceae bacterium]|jgi:hypothetical protein|nr:DUF3301 domain-containing protein [Thiobacillaceae bacterium]